MSSPRSVAGRKPTAAALETKGWLGANRFLLLRRASQLGFLGLFLIGPISCGWPAMAIWNRPGGRSRATWRRASRSTPCR